MTNTGPDGSGPDAGDSSWTDETLPMSLRRELLDRELQKYTARRTAPTASSPSRGASQDGGNHPSADGHTAGEHAD
jgi:hypothetical protein